MTRVLGWVGAAGSGGRVGRVERARPGRPGRPRRPRRPRRGVVLLAVALPLALAACAGSGYHYVKSSENKTYFKVPDSWKLYDQESILDSLKGALSKDEIAERRDTSWATVFDADPNPSLRHLGRSYPRHPLGRAIVQPLSPEASDSASLQSLRNIFFDVDDALQGGKAQVMRYDLVQLPGGFHGSRLEARLEGRRGSITFNQVAVFDQSTSKVYAITVYCRTECYNEHKSKIDSVIDSWTVRDT